MKTVVLTGWTCCGKTSILEELASRWYSVFSEVAGHNMKPLQHLLWEDYTAWRTEFFTDFQRMNFFDSMKVYFQALETSKPKDNIIFFDRWLYDWIASFKREWYSVPESFNKITKKIQYDYCFHIEALPKHLIRANEWRMLNSDMSEKWAKYITQEYALQGIPSSVVIYGEWCSTVEERADRVLEIIKNIGLSNKTINE